jgi:drug/metabolite transporter (DMT)-like permease
VPASALALTLAAAVVHAAWNAGLARSWDVPAATAAAMVSGAVLLTPAGIAGWDVEAAAWPYLGGSIVAETAYMALLAAAYARADVSVVYPVARGSAPVLVLVVAGAAASQAAGVLVIAAGVVAVRGLRRPESALDLALALAIGATIATYTLLDKEGLEHAATVPYLWVEVGTAGLLYAAFVGRRRVRPALGPRTALIGAAAFASYGLVLAALQLAPAPAVAAVRETSVVFAVALGALWLGEPVTRARALGAVLVAAGVALVAVG